MALEITEIKIDSLPSVNFGPGVELLMNGKKKDAAPDSIKIADIDTLEIELNSLSKSLEKPSESIKVENLDPLKADPPRSSVRFDAGPTLPVPKEAIKEVANKTWDGFKSLNNVDPEMAKPEISKEETIKQKFTYLRKLEELESKGVNLTKKYSMESNLLEMQGEYDNIVAEKERKNNVKFQGKMLMACITGLEFMNSKFDPFDVKLDGWAEQVNENISDYDEIFSELHDKYKSKAKLAPELKLLFQLGGSAIMLHMTNTMFKSSIPGMDDIMRQNPELMQKFTQAAVNSVGATNPGLGGFMNTVLKEKPPTPEYSGARSTSYMNTARMEPKRSEMRGPSDISDILSGLKKMPEDDDASSTISISEIKDLNEEVLLPKKSKKRTPKSDKNVMSLNLE